MVIPMHLVLACSAYLQAQPAQQGTRGRNASNSPNSFVNVGSIESRQRVVKLGDKVGSI